MKKRSVIFTLTLVLSLMVTGCSGDSGTAASVAESSPSSASSQNAEAKVIEFALDTGIKPYSFLDDNDQLTGYDREVLDAIDKLLPQYEFHYNPVGQSSATQIGTESGKYDVGVDYYFKNPTREQKFLFQETPYGYVNLLAITKKGAPTINSFDELVGKKIYPVMAASGVPGILTGYNNAHPDRQIDYPTTDNFNEADSLKAVASGEYEVTLENSTPFAVIQQTLNLDLVGGEPLSHEGFYFLVNKKESQLNSDLNEAIIALQKDGTLSKLSQKWLLEDVFASDTSASSASSAQ